jgi:uncharacterized protein (DUF362 family)
MAKKSIVSIRKTTGIYYAEIENAVKNVIKDIGGLSDVIKPGYKVIIKPNMVAVPPARLSGAVTRWEVCLAICREVEKVGGVPVIAESAAVGADTEDVIMVCGYNDVRDSGVQVVDLKSRKPVAEGRMSAGEKCTVDVPDGRIAKEILTWELVRDADAIITVPVMKTHDQTEITLGMKNLKGLMEDKCKKRFHFDGLTESVVDLNTVFRPCVEIVDGTFAAEGIGPVFGDTKRMDLIVGSKDIVACEAVTGKIMGYEPEEVPITVAAAERGLGTMDLSEIEIAGERIEDVEERFVRCCETKIEGIADSFQILSGSGTCTGCRNTIVSILMEMKEKGFLKYTEDLTIISGPPEDIDEDQIKGDVVCVGSCAQKYAAQNGYRCAAGCPPRNDLIVEAILNGREDYDSE